MHESWTNECSIHSCIHIWETFCVCVPTTESERTIWSVDTHCTLFIVQGRKNIRCSTHHMLTTISFPLVCTCTLYTNYACHLAHVCASFMQWTHKILSLLRLFHTRMFGNMAYSHEFEYCIFEFVYLFDLLQSNAHRLIWWPKWNDGNSIDRELSLLFRT